MVYLDPNLMRDLLEIELLRRAAERQRQLDGHVEGAGTTSPATRRTSPGPGGPGRRLRTVIREWFGFPFRIS